MKTMLCGRSLIIALIIALVLSPFTFDLGKGGVISTLAFARGGGGNGGSDSGGGNGSDSGGGNGSDSGGGNGSDSGGGNGNGGASAGEANTATHMEMNQVRAESQEMNQYSHQYQERVNQLRDDASEPTDDTTNP